MPHKAAGVIITPGGGGGTEKVQILVGGENKRNRQNKKREKRNTNLNYADRTERPNDDAGQVTDLGGKDGETINSHRTESETESTDNNG